MTDILSFTSAHCQKLLAEHFAIVECPYEQSAESYKKAESIKIKYEVLYGNFEEDYSRFYYKTLHDVDYAGFEE